jgi:DNA-binding MarR family transcriptional regulator
MTKMEYLRQLGDLVIDHRLRRVMESLLRTAEEIYESRGLPFRARWTSTYLLLEQSGPLSVTEIADQIGLTHPGVIAITDEMAAADMVVSVADDVDRRRRRIELSQRGRELKPDLTALWAELARAQRKRFRDAGCDIVEVLNQVEDSLIAKSLAAEVISRVSKKAKARPVIMMAALVAALASCVSAPVHAQSRAHVVNAIATNLTDGYIYEKTGRVMADSLNAALAAGRFERLNEQAFADSLTALLRRISNDAHLSVGYGGPQPTGDGPRMVRRRPTQPESGAAFNPRDYGIERAEILPGNIGYIDMISFGDAPALVQYVDSVMASFADVSALVIDLRNNRGGGPQLIQLISTYLFDRPVHLVTTMMRGMQTPSERWTLDSVKGKRMPKTPVYILTSSRTISAGESFTFGLKVTGRATIVGERTRGGGHFGGFIDLPDQFRMFLPRGRTYDPRTNQGWEAEGIKPDIAVPADKALETVLNRVRASKLPART